jgi:SAM-dependent methyltransferase
MRGDFETRAGESRDFFEKSGVSPEKSGKALDLGCGSGFQTLALARLGFDVVGVDSSEALLRELEGRSEANLEVRTVLGDMREPRTYAEYAPFEVAVCMGDTLTHLRSKGEAANLIRDVYEHLEEGGRLVLQFRDLTRELEGADRAIPVKTDDEDRVMATFLEYEAEHVNVHDMVFIREPSGWKMEKSAYKKVRLGAEEVVEFMERAGFEIVEHSENEGFTAIIGRR